MQGKALAALLLVVAVALLGGCGGGGDDETTTSGAAAEVQQGAGAEQIEKRAAEVSRERKAQEDRAERNGKHAGTSGASSSGHPQAPQLKNSRGSGSHHHDSGGGSGQFRSEGGDNSIQEYGDEASPAERAAAASALHGFLDARSAGSWEEACAQLSADLVASMEKFAEQYGNGVQGCPGVLERLSGAQARAALLAAAKVDVASLRAANGRGFLIYTTPDGTAYAIPVVMEAGTWKLAGLDGSPLP